MAMLYPPLGHRDGEEWAGVGWGKRGADLRRGFGEGWGNEDGGAERKGCRKTRAIGGAQERGGGWGTGS